MIDSEFIVGPYAYSIRLRLKTNQSERTTSSITRTMKNQASGRFAKGRVTFNP